MKLKYLLAASLMSAALAGTGVFAQDRNQGGQQTPARGQENRTTQPRQAVRPAQNPPAKTPPNRTRKLPSQVAPPRRSANQPNRNAPTQQAFQPRAGQAVIAPNRGWSPNLGHAYHSTAYVSVDIWTATTFGGNGRTYQWNPATWHYSVEDSLMTLVYRTERLSNTMREDFETSMNQYGLRTSPGGQTAWDRVQRMDEALERLRSETGSVSESEMQNSAVEALSLAQQVASSFSRYPNLMDLVPNEWNDLEFEINELARYYDEPAVR